MRFRREARCRSVPVRQRRRYRMLAAVWGRRVRPRRAGGDRLPRRPQAGIIRARQLMLRDPRPPVLYLRSFGDDRLKLWTATFGRPSLIERFTLRRFDTFEEVLVRYLSAYGPVIAVNPPGTRLAPLGAARETIDSAEWQAAVATWMAQSRLIVFATPPSQVTGGSDGNSRLFRCTVTGTRRSSSSRRCAQRSCRPGGVTPRRGTVAVHGPRSGGRPARAGAGAQEWPVARDQRGPANRVVLRRRAGAGPR